MSVFVKKSIKCSKSILLAGIASLTLSACATSPSDYFNFESFFGDDSQAVAAPVLMGDATGLAVAGTEDGANVLPVVSDANFQSDYDDLDAVLGQSERYVALDSEGMEIADGSGEVPAGDRAQDFFSDLEDDEILTGSIGNRLGNDLAEDLYRIDAKYVKSTHEVQPGETLYSIARSYDVDVTNLIRVNRIPNPNSIEIGRKLAIPQGNFKIRKESKAASLSKVEADEQSAVNDSKGEIANTYIVKKGDTLYSIARRARVPLALMAKANNVKDSAMLKVGQRLQLPARQHQSSVVKPRTAQEITTSALSEMKGVTARTQAAEAIASVSRYSDTGSVGDSVSAHRWPAAGRVVSTFGSTVSYGSNFGINISAPTGARVVASESGEVVKVTETPRYGKVVAVRHPAKIVTIYAHLSDIAVEAGQTVKRGEPIGKVGKTGDVSSPQLHFMMRDDGKPVDPIVYLAKK